MEGKENYDAASDTAPMPDLDGGQNVSVSDAEGGIKRDLSSRHINMIAIAGMIVSCWCSLKLLAIFLTFNARELVYSSAQAR